MGAGMGSYGRGGGMGGHGRHSNSAAGRSIGNTGTASVDLRLHAQALIIRQSEVVFDIDADGRRMVYRFDNRRTSGTPAGSKSTLAWSAPEMTLQTHPEGGGLIEEHYSLSPDGKQLTQLIREQPAGADTFRESKRQFVRDDNGDEGSSPLPP